MCADPDWLQSVEDEQMAMVSLEIPARIYVPKVTSTAFRTLCELHRNQKGLDGHSAGEQRADLMQASPLELADAMPGYQSDGRRTALDRSLDDEFDGWDLSCFRHASPVINGTAVSATPKVGAERMMGSEKGEERLSVADVAALTRMFEEHRARLLVMLQSRIDPAMAVRVSAEDVLHETFFLARRRWHRFGGLRNDSLLVALPPRDGHSHRDLAASELRWPRPASLSAR